MSAAWVLQGKQELFNIGLVANTRWNIPFGTMLLSQKSWLKIRKSSLKRSAWGKSCNVNLKSFLRVGNLKTKKKKKIWWKQREPAPRSVCLHWVDPWVDEAQRKPVFKTKSLLWPFPSSTTQNAPIAAQTRHMFAEWRFYTAGDFIMNTTVTEKLIHRSITANTEMCKR